jgi:UBX domain-containing protein 1
LLPGFTVNGGPLRAMEDPANAPFMEAIASGMYPEELRPDDPDTPVHVNLVRKEEAWAAPPEPKYTAFSGAGRTLGGSAGASGSGASGSGAGAAAAAASAPAVGAWEVDEAAPVTSIQLRLADGSRVVARFNTSHTVAHIRAFIERVRPGSGATGTLQVGGMPPRTLTDASATLADAGLLNAVVIQKP